MKRLTLQPITAAFAQASRKLGTGVTLPFAVRGIPGELQLEATQAGEGHDQGIWFGSAAGPFKLSDASAVLSLLGESPVIVKGETQAWYWQFISQHLSPAIAEGLAPLEPWCAEPPQGLLIHCRLRVQVGNNQVHAYWSASPETLLQWLDTPSWQYHRNPLPAMFELTFPLVLGRMTLTAAQLESLRPGDVLLPTECLFNSEGYGHLVLADRRWLGHTQCSDRHLSLTLSHEEDSHHEQY
ncbi:type III secretion system protein [Pseudomonas asuensis]|uniref:Type III secretion protein hrcQa n=1 Tax=Pseudomonas asuensis TaxID=1825787 RepID=A0ABQ2H372_9PSED|nr:type III secretion system protein [Pseudomonas asuensis]GGM31099.1 type III secretion protein hrcQa [Pseudomonas asuensis]